MIALRPDQKEVVKNIIQRPNLYIIAQMGAGKTISTLFALYALIARGDVKNVLIIAPKRVAQSVWVQEAEKWGFDTNIMYCKTGLDVKIELYKEPEHAVCVTSVTRIHEIVHGCWDMVIIDEPTLFGNKKAQRSKEVRRICNGVPRRLLLSGTPIHGGYEKMFHQIFLLDGGKALGRSLTVFRATYMKVKYQMKGVTTVYEMNPLMIDKLQRDIKHLVYNVQYEVELPPLLVKKIYVDLPPSLRATYDRLEKVGIASFQAETGKDAYTTNHNIVAFSKTSIGVKLRQFVSGTMYTDTNDLAEAEMLDMTEDERLAYNKRRKSEQYAFIHSLKFDVLKEIVENSARGVMAVYNFTSELEELRKAFPKGRTLDSDEDVKAWNNGGIPVIFVHPQGAAWGLNLQFGGNIVAWVTPTYNAELFAQLNKRLHRNGQQDAVTLALILAKGTIDDKVLEAAMLREQTAEQFRNSKILKNDE